MGDLEELVAKDIADITQGEVPVVKKCEHCPLQELIFEGEGKCVLTNYEKCNCETPYVIKFFKKNPSFGICDKCHHIAILRNGKWLHYSRSYRCGFPYFSQACEAPKILPTHLSIPILQSLPETKKPEKTE